MRVVGGTQKGRRLEAPEGAVARPTSDRAREALFNLLTQGRVAGEGNPVIGARVLDAFAGTGALGIEALSRGAGEACFMEKDAAALKALRANIRHCGLDQKARVIPADVLSPPEALRPCDILLLDPPYNKGLGAAALAALAQAGWVARGALVALEVERKDEVEAPEGFDLLDERHYGKAKLLFFGYLKG
jgi:16S rRNA (guanine966-N2)-methyltransferase